MAKKIDPIITLAQDPRLAPEEFKRLAELNQAHLSKTLCLNRNCTAEALDIIIKDHMRNYGLLTLKLAFHHRNLSDHTLSRFLGDLNSKMRSYAISSPKVTLDQLNELVVSADDKAIVGIICNPNCDSKLLKFIYDENSWNKEIIFHLSSSKNTPCEILSEIYTRVSKDNYGRVKRSLVLNPNTPEDIYSFLTQDQDSYVLEAFIFKDYLSQTENNKTSLEVLTSILRSGCPRLIPKVLTHSKIEEEILLEYKDYPPPLPQAIARNPNAGRELLLDLHRKGIRSAINHKNFPAEIREVRRLLMIKKPLNR